MKENKGIWYQIRDSSKITVNGELTRKDLQAFFEKAEKVELENRRRKEDISEQNRKHLAKRSKDLGKEIPFELMCYFDPYLNPSRMVGSWFFEKYKEWF